MKTVLRVILVVLLATMLGAAYLWWQAQQRGTPTPTIAEVPLAPSEPAAPPGPRYPIPAAAPATEADAAPPWSEEQIAQEIPPPEADPAESLPALNDSGVVMSQLLSGLFGEQALTTLFNSDEFIRRFVVTVDNLPNKKLPRQNLLFKRVAGQFLVAGEGELRSISPDNAQRYAPYVQLAAGVEPRRLANLYIRYYPLFQEAYAELGNPNAYFNDRLVEVIDHLVETPTVEEPIPVIRPKVFYQYADPALEALSAGQKALLRMGGAHAGQIKARLRVLRQALTHELPPAGGNAQDAAPITP